MKNDYGVSLDRNNYAPSIIQPETDYPRCWICLRTDGKLDRHEVFAGAGRRDKCKRLGLWVYLCHGEHHMYGPEAVHNNAKAREALQRIAQIKAMQAYGWTAEDFIREFGKNYA